MAYKIGDVIILKSGGPKMSVTEPLDSYGRVAAMWFAGAKREHGSFPPDAIELASEHEKK